MCCLWATTLHDFPGECFLLSGRCSQSRNFFAFSFCANSEMLFDFETLGETGWRLNIWNLSGACTDWRTGFVRKDYGVLQSPMHLAQMQSKWLILLGWRIFLIMLWLEVNVSGLSHFQILTWRPLNKLEFQLKMLLQLRSVTTCLPTPTNGCKWWFIEEWDLNLCALHYCYRYWNKLVLKPVAFCGCISWPAW